MITRLLDVFVDRGGTFTDMVAKVDDGTIIVKKVLSENAASTLDPLTVGLKLLHEECCLLYPGASVLFKQIRIGTTVATNALLERKGERVLLITNKGFKDALQIGYQNRPDIFALEIIKGSPLYADVVELPCRFNSAGLELVGLEEEPALLEFQKAKAQKFKSAAVLFMHGYKFPKHELACKKLCSDIGIKNISLSSEVNPLIKFVSRGDTTLVDAYLTPALKRYTETIIKELSENLPFIDRQKAFLFMKSDGGLATETDFRGRDALLSGPAGGVVGAVKAAQSAGFTNVVALDMGGTSTDVSYFDGEFERLYETTLAAVRVRSPMLAVHTVAAGGGSILDFDGARFLVGPESAGALPGPACYGHGGPLTVTDANLVLGRICPNYFPTSFGKDFKSPLNIIPALEKFTSLQLKLKEAKTASSQFAYNKVEEIAWGFLTIAVEKMAQAISKVSTQKGHDVSEAVLVAFGGAGGQHACLIAEKLGITKILLHPLAGVLSAWGIGATERSSMRERALGVTLDERVRATLGDQFGELAGAAVAHLELKENELEQLTTENKLFLRYPGADTNLTVLFDGQDLPAIQADFKAKHQKLFGFAGDGEILSIEAIMSTVSTLSQKRSNTIAQSAAHHGLSPGATSANSDAVPIHRLFAAGQWFETKIVRRHDLTCNDKLHGPLLIAEDTATTILEPGWTAQVLEDGSLLLETASRGNNELGAGCDGQYSPRTKQTAEAAVVDPVRLELFSNIFMSIAEEMGITLQQVSHSVNIKERLDFSCALFDGQGRLIANAPHIPVHLGSMGDSVKSLIQVHGPTAKSGERLREGDVYVLNNPYNGGTHLPDITVISPVFQKGGAEPIFYVASRGHHADIGGISPGSMPATSTQLDEEGVLIDNFKVVQLPQLGERAEPEPITLAHAEFKEREFIALLESAKFPPRNIPQNIADLKAQIAANNKGISALQSLVFKYGLPVVTAYMEHVRANAAFAIRSVLPSLHDGQASCTMDDGSIIQVKITIDRSQPQAERAIVDFSGTSKQAANNLNSPLSVCRAAVLYVFRTLTRQAIPLNDGCMDPIELIVPQGLLNPSPPAAVVAGNVETSQIIVDTLYRALGVMAASQGTMNNFTFGDGDKQYYETICGGSGAGPHFNGADAVQTHMTNSRLTDPEILETRYPVLLEEFSVRANSGGVGKHTGGSGSKRRIKFLKEMSASILSNRRSIAPPGLAGGGDGLPGRNSLIKADGRIIDLGSTASIAVEAGDAILIETPGGGAYGAYEPG